MKAPRVAIVGGSLTGATTALMLQAAGFEDVTVFEAVPPTVSLAGGVIGLEHPALDLLDRLGIPQDEFVPFTSERVVAVEVLDRSVAGNVATIYPGRNTTWTMLHRALSSRLPAGTVVTGTRVTGLDEDPDGLARLTFDNGDDLGRWDLVIFCDGRRSVGRKILDPGRRLRYAGYVAHRGMNADCPPDLRDFTRVEPGGAQFNLFPVVRPSGDLGTDWTFYLNTHADDFRAMFGGAPTVRTFIHNVSTDARRVVDSAAYAILPDRHAATVRTTDERMAAPVVDIDPPTRMVWPVGGARAVLIGDALAPVRPHTARGANNGIEQAAGLVAALTQHRKYDADRDGALLGWETRSLPAHVASVHRGPIMGRKLGLGA